MIWKQKARKNLPVSVAKELMASLKESLERGDEAPIGRTAKQVTGFKGRSGRSFRAKLKIERREDDPNRWKVEFDEEWATMSAKEREEAAAAAEEAAAAAGNGDGKPAEISEAPAEPQRAAS